MQPPLALVLHISTMRKLINTPLCMNTSQIIPTAEVLVRSQRLSQCPISGRLSSRANCYIFPILVCGMLVNVHRIHPVRHFLFMCIGVLLACTSAPHACRWPLLSDSPELNLQMVAVRGCCHAVHVKANRPLQKLRLITFLTRENSPKDSLPLH